MQQIATPPFRIPQKPAVSDQRLASRQETDTTLEDNIAGNEINCTRGMRGNRLLVSGNQRLASASSVML